MATDAAVERSAVEDQDVVQQVPPLPPPGELVDDKPLYLTQIANYRSTLAFAGQKNPSTIWTSMVRDDSSAIVYYRELEEKDEDVGDALDSLKYSVLSRERSIEPGDESQAAQEAADFIEDQLDALPNFDNALDNMLDMCGYGFSAAEMIFDVSMGQASLVDIHDCPQELFLFGERFRPQIGPLQLLDSPWAISGKQVPEGKFVITTYRGRARNRMGRPLLRSVFWPSWFKRNVLGFWLRYSEKGPGTAVVKYNDGANDADRKKAAELALALIESAAVGVPQNFAYDPELLKTARSITPDVYEHLYQQMQYSIARRILGQTLTSFGGEGGKGTQALGNVHQETLEVRSVAVAKTLMSSVNWQIVRRMHLWNFGPNVPQPVWKLDIEEEEDLARELTIDQGVQRMGVTMPLGYLQQKYQVPAVQGNEPVATPNATAPEPGLTDRISFSERDKQVGAIVDRDLAQFDSIVQQLKDESLRLYKTRVAEIAGATKIVE